MFDIGWAELAIIGVVALIVVGPKDLPVVLRTGAHWMRQARKLSREFQSGVDSIVREADLDDAKKIVTSARQGTLKRQIESTIDPTGEMKRSLDPNTPVHDNKAAAGKPAIVTPAIAAPAATEPPTATVDAAPSMPASQPAEAAVAVPADKPAEPAGKIGS
ncbi:MAG: Sec-independent protein translocase protein TatB [Dongiaceae bacterium]